jgi:hypothetical protein
VADKTNVQRLQEAGIIPASHKLTPDDIKVVESLSLDEIAVMVSVKIKLDKGGVQGQAGKFFI